MSLNNVSLRQAGKADWPAISLLLQSNGLPLDGAEAHICPPSSSPPAKAR